MPMGTRHPDAICYRRVSIVFFDLCSSRKVEGAGRARIQPNTDGGTTHVARPSFLVYYHAALPLLQHHPMPWFDNRVWLGTTTANGRLLQPPLNQSRLRHGAPPPRFEIQISIAPRFPADLDFHPTSISTTPRFPPHLDFHRTSISTAPRFFYLCFFTQLVHAHWTPRCYCMRALTTNPPTANSVFIKHSSQTTQRGGMLLVS